MPAENEKSMATIVLQVPDESLVNKVKQICKMLQGVASVKVQRNSESRELNVTRTQSFKEAMDDVEQGRVNQYDSAEDLFEKLGISL